MQMTPLLIACDSGHGEVVHMLLGAAADKEARDSMQMTPLLIACDRGHGEVVQGLLSAGCRCYCLPMLESAHLCTSRACVHMWTS